MLPSVVKEARIWAFDYNSNYSHDAQTVKIDGLAVTLLNCMKNRRGDFESRKIIFIGSCFGGIVVAEVRIFKRFLRSEYCWSKLMSKTTGAIDCISRSRTQKSCVRSDGWCHILGITAARNQSGKFRGLEKLRFWNSWPRPGVL